MVLHFCNVFSQQCTAFYRACNFAILSSQFSPRSRLYLPQIVMKNWNRICNCTIAESVELLVQACQSLDMHSFLMLPMQRITRLPLLTDRIICRLPPDSSELAAARKALHLTRLAANFLFSTSCFL
jgi:hypothetical protein